MTPAAVGISVWLVALLTCGLIVLMHRMGARRFARSTALWPLWLMAFATVQGVALTPRLQQVDFSPEARRPPIVDRINFAVLLASLLLGVFSIGLTLMSTRVRYPKFGLPLLVSFLVFTLGLLVVGQFSAHPGANPLHAMVVPVAGAALVIAPKLDLQGILWHARWVLRCVVWGSLVTAVLIPGWCFPADAQVNDRVLFGVPQMFGLTNQGNALGAAAAVAVVLEVAGTKRRWRMHPHLYASALVLVLAQSRIAVLAALVGVLLLHATRVRLARYALVAAVTLVAIATVTSPTVADSLQTSYSNSNLESVNGRTVIWSISLKEFQADRLVGYGPDLFGVEYRKTLPPNLQHAGQGHNQLLHTLGASGLVGTAILVLYLMVLLAAAARGRGAASGLSLSLVAVLLVRGLTDVPLLHKSPDLNLVLHLVTLVAVYKALPARKRTATPGSGLAELGHEAEGDQLRPDAVDQGDGRRRVRGGGRGAGWPGDGGGSPEGQLVGGEHADL